MDNKPKMKKVVLAVAIVALCAGAAAAGLYLLEKSAPLKPRVQAALSGALGMDVRIGGGMGISLVPGPGVTFEDMTVRSRGTDLLSAGRVRVGLRLLPLLRRKVDLRSVELRDTAVKVEREKDGSYNFQRGPETTEPAEAALPEVDKLALTKGSFVYTDLKTGMKAEMKGITLNLEDLSLGGNGLADASMRGSLRCETLRVGRFQASNMRLAVKAEKGVFDLSPVEMDVFGGKGKGSVKADLAAKPRDFHVNYTISKLRLEDLLGEFSQKKIMKGTTDLSADLAAGGETWQEMKGTLGGKVSLRGEGLVLEGIDLDALLKEYQKSQSFNLVDIGAYFFAGPLGTALSKGYDFASVYKETRGGQTRVSRLLSDWRVRDGVASAEDVAMRTEKYRVALRGKLDFPGGMFDRLTVAVVDDRGCAALSQTVNGPFADPRVERPNIIESLAGPVFGILKRTGKLLGVKCEVFYSGSVKPPVEAATPGPNEPKK
jgi:hypothetical protein